MDLHQMFGTVVADLPDLPDQVPAARRIHRRRAARARAGAFAAAAALVVGVGTLTFVSPWGGRQSAAAVRVAGGATSQASGPTAPTLPASVKEISPSERTAAPALSGVTVGGATLSASYAGHVTVLDLWGSWCTPCRQEGSTLGQAYQKYRSESVQFLGLDERDDNTAAQSFQTAFGIDYPSLRDPDSVLADRLSRFMSPDVVPSLVIVDPNGKVAATVQAAVTSAELDGMIDYALGATAASSR
jgi:thiol-disulfide isomerase/thioredoxin